MNTDYFLLTGSPPPTDNFEETIEAIESLPQFFADSVNWGIEASYTALGFMCLMSLVVYLFKK
ncbi:MAG: hypothetical protein QNJ42_18705 [Crocosphaera sp.]|nr:hypothetical protein [Crocosphaera sp.]